MFFPYVFVYNIFLHSSSLPDDPISDWDYKLVGRIITDHVKNKKIQMVSKLGKCFILICMFVSG